MKEGWEMDTARHFERISRDNDAIDTQPSEAVPVQLLLVKALESITDDIKDKSDLSDSSCEADGEGDSEDDTHNSSETNTLASFPEQSQTLLTATV
ncbi:hypothetical protein V8B97DRAFT_2009417 [Scleroderma yunnanense]